MNTTHLEPWTVADRVRAAADSRGEDARDLTLRSERNLPGLRPHRRVEREPPPAAPESAPGQR